MPEKVTNISKIKSPSIKQTEPKEENKTVGKVSDGRNSVVPAELEQFFDRLDKLHDDKASKNAEYMADIRTVYEEASDATDLKKRNIREVYKEHRHALMTQRRRSEMEREDLDEIDLLESTLGELGKWASAQSA